MTKTNNVQSLMLMNIGVTHSTVSDESAEGSENYNGQVVILSHHTLLMYFAVSYCFW